jgi:pSer/pThr/pTyr-binding forkhead associated (FHA) protein
MITCPSCYNQEMVGALFCSVCGAQLTYQSRSPTDTVQYNEDGSVPDSSAETRAINQTSDAAARVNLRLIQTGQNISLESGADYTIGRISGTQPILPDIDLTPYHAYEGGVSRLHATIRVSEDSVSVSDLGSANGTMVNGQKIPSYEPHPLHSGDIIVLGKFQIEIKFS